MKLTVVIPARNEERNLPQQLDALLGQDCAADWEVVVVDNGSVDGTVGVVEQYARNASRVHLLRATERADKSYALMTAVTEFPADAYAFCDADDVVADGWLNAIAAGLSAHDVVTGPNELDLLNPPWLARSRGGSDTRPVGSYYGIFPCIRGNNFAVRSSVWQVVGPLASGFYPVEDTEFSLRCWLNGIDVVGLPDAVVHYRYRQSPRDLWRQGFAYGSHRPMIAKLLRDAGRRTPSRVPGWRSWLLLLVTLPTVVTRNGRARWLWIAGNRAGQVAGSLRHRTMQL